MSTGNRLSNPDLLSPEPEPDSITRLVVGCPSPSLIRLVIMEEASKIEESEYDIPTGNKTQIEHIYQQTVFVQIEYMRHAHQIHGRRAYLLKTHPTCASQSASPPPHPQINHKLSQTRHIPLDYPQLQRLSHRQQSRPSNRRSPKVYRTAPRADLFG